MAVVCIAGDSNVVSQQDSLAGGANKDLMPSKAARMLGMTHLVQEIRYFGYRGITPRQFVISEELSSLTRIDLTLLWIGTNELAAGGNPIEAANDVIRLAQEIMRCSFTQHVTICSVIPRTGNLRITPEQFGLSRNVFNVEVRTLARDISNISFHRMQGFDLVSIGEWSKDNIHPNTSVGRTLVINNFKRAMNVSVHRSNPC